MQEKWKKRTSTPNPHVGGGNGKETIVYNTKEGKKEGGTKKKTKEKREKEKEKREKT